MRTLRNLVFAAAIAGLGATSAGCIVAETPPPAYAYDYQPQYYDGYVVYYDDYGRPYYYAGGAAYWIPPASPYYRVYVAHWHRYGPAYHRWYVHDGYRYRGYRRR